MYKTKIKALIICNSYPSKADPITGGMFIADQVKWLKSFGVESIVVRPVRFNITKRMLFPNRDLIKSWRKWINGFQIEPEGIINGQKVYYPKYMGLPQAVFMWCVGHIVYSQTNKLFKKIFTHFKPDIIHTHYMIPNVYLGHILSKKYKIPHIVSVMGSDAHQCGSRGGGRYLTIKVMQKISGVIVKSNDLKDIMISNYLVNSNKVKTIINGVDTKQFFVSSKKTKSSKKQLLFIGNLEKRKDIIGNLLPAIDYLRNTRNDFSLDIIGDGPQAKEIKAKIIELNLDAYVRLHGGVLHNSIRTYFDSADLFILSTIREGTPNVIMEGLACGIPVVSCKVAGIPDLVNKDCGILVPPSNPELLANAINDALNRDWNHKIIREYAENNLDISNKVLKIRAFYDAAIQQHNEKN